jgi:hypothetical protein
MPYPADHAPSAPYGLFQTAASGYHEAVYMCGSGASFHSPVPNTRPPLVSARAWQAEPIPPDSSYTLICENGPPMVPIA